MRLNKGAFCNCSKLIRIIIPDSVESIENETFRNCSALESIIVGSSVKYIAKGAFYDCSSLSSVEFKDTENWYIEENGQLSCEMNVDILRDRAVLASFLRGMYTRNWSLKKLFNIE